MADAATLLASVEAAITARLAGGTVESYSIRGRNLAYVKLTELFELRDKLKREVENEKGTSGLPVAYGVKDRRLAES
jgi:hypothetical protein